MLIRRKINRGLICHNEPIKNQFIRVIISAPNGLNIIVSVVFKEFRLKVLRREHQGILLHEFSKSFSPLSRGSLSASEIFETGRGGAGGVVREGGASSPISGPSVQVAVVATRQDALWSTAVYAKRQTGHTASH